MLSNPELSKASSAILLTVIMIFSFAGCGRKDFSKEKNFEFDQYEGYEISFKIPKGWERISENDFEGMMQHIYAPAGSGEYKENQIAVYSFTDMGNEYHNEEEIDRYLEILTDNFFHEIEGSLTYEKIENSGYECSVPARYGNYIQEWNGKTREVRAYFFILSGDTIFQISYIHDVDSSEEYFDEFDAIIKLLEFEPFFCESDSSSVSQSGGSSDESFTNKFGTPTTKCAHSGCDNYIAPSGDTNCCKTHSAKCLECGCYIDEDALFCISCLTGN